MRSLFISYKSFCLETDNRHMRITAIRETTASLTSTMRNAFIDFSKMTLSVVAVETDVVRDGRRVVGGR